MSGSSKSTKKINDLVKLAKLCKPIDPILFATYINLEILYCNKELDQANKLKFKNRKSRIQSRHDTLLELAELFLQEKDK